MEGVPRIPMLGFPIKRSADVPDYRSNIKKFISQHYNEDPEAYSNEISTLDSLRAGAVHVCRDFTGCATLKKYFCQLHYLKSRFPFQEESQIATSFSWYDVHSDTVHGWKDIDFEMSCILYNIGALHSELGSKDTRLTAEDMKTSCTHFQCAAWAFQHLKTEYHKFFSPDLSSDMLSIMGNICLAQAQECILEKSLIDNRKSAITAKVSLQIVEYYQLTLKTIDIVLKKSSPSHTDKVLKAVKKWRDLVEVKIYYYGSLSYLYRGLQSEEQSKFGERITFFKAAMEKLTEAAKLMKSMDKNDNSALLVETLNFTTDVIGTKLSSSEKENEFIYHEKVPTLESLGADFKGVSLVKGIPFKFDDPEVSGPDIFARLVPMEAHEASSLYSEEKAKIMRQYASKIEEKNEALERFLLALQLDQLDFHSEETKIPQALVDCCAALSVNPEAVKKLSSLMSKLSGMFHDVEHNIKEISELLKAEDMKEKEFQEIVGKRPPNNLLTELSREIKKYQHAHSVASESNQTLHEAMRVHVLNLQILLKPLPEVLKHIPSVAEIEERDETAINEMRRLRLKIEEMQKQREMLMNQLRESILNDDITKSLVVKQDQVLETVFEEELKKHEKITQVLDQNMVAQENILRATLETNATYAATRKATEEVLKKRNNAINTLLSSYDAYNELLIKCTQGVEFYTKLDANVSKLLQRVKSVCKVQEEEREERSNAIIKTTQIAKETTNYAYYDTTSQHAKDSYPSMYANYAAACEMPSNPNIDNTVIQQQYEKNLALQQEYEKLTKLQQQLSKESSVQYATYSNMGQQQYSTNSTPNYSTNSTPNYTTSLSSPMPGQFGTGLNSFSQYYGQVASSSTQQQQQYTVGNLSQAYSTNSTQAYTSALSSQQQQQYPTSSTQPHQIHSSQIYQANDSQAYPNTSPLSPVPQPVSQQYISPTNNSSVPASQQYIPPTNNSNVPASQQYIPPTNNSSVPASQQYIPPTNNSSVPTSQQQHQSYAHSHLNSATTSSYVSNSLSTQMTYPNNYTGQQSYPPPHGSVTADSTLPASVNPQTCSPNAPVMSQQYSSSVDSSNPSQQQWDNNKYSHNPLLQQFSQQYDLDKSTPTSQSQSYGTYTILGQHQYGQPTGPSQYGSNLYNFEAPQQSQQSVYGQQQQNPSNMYNNMTNQAGYTSPTSTGPLSMNYMTNNPQQLSSQDLNYSYNGGGGGYMNYYGQPDIPEGTYSQEQPQQSVQSQQPYPSLPLEKNSSQKTFETTRSNQKSVLHSVIQQKAESAGNQSNIDLLSGIDLTLVQKPLQPVSSFLPCSSTTDSGHCSNNHKERGTEQSSASLPAKNSAISSIVTSSLASVNVDTDNHVNHDPENNLQLKPTGLNESRKPIIVDYLSDTGALDKFTRDVENLEHVVEGFYKKSLNGPTNLDIKWKEVIDIQNAASIKMSISVARCYPMKNRYPDILPHDQTRVPLPCTKDDYINASFVKGISTTAIPFIATQAPLPVTYSDFWHMVWYYHVELIACLASDIDLKEHIYWPLERGKDLVFGPLSISLQSRNVKSGFVERIFCMTHRDLKQTRVTIHLQMTTWTGNVFPESPASLLQFLTEVHNYFLQQRSLSRPVVAHCMAGVGKTGIFLLLSAALRDIQNGKSFPDLTSISGMASEQRKGILIDKEYLRFSYQTLLYYCQDLLMKRGILSARAAFDERPKMTHTRHPSSDFMTETIKSVVNTENHSTNGNGENNSLPCTPSHRNQVDVSFSPRARIYSDVPASLMDIDVSTFQKLTSKDNNEAKGNDYFESRKGALAKKPDDVQVDPLNNLDALWNLKKQ